MNEVTETPAPIDTPWTRLDEAVEDFIDSYELVDCEDDQGRTGDYTPTENERLLISDCLQGILADEDLLELIVAARAHTRAARRAEGCCEACGSPPPEHFGRCRAVDDPAHADRARQIHYALQRIDRQLLELLSCPSIDQTNQQLGITFREIIETARRDAGELDPNDFAKLQRGDDDHAKKTESQE